MRVFWTERQTSEENLSTERKEAFIDESSQGEAVEIYWPT